MAGVARAVPPEPPAETIPRTPPARPIQRSKASAMAPTEAPRSPVKTAFAPRGWWAATWCGGTSAEEGRPEVDRSTVRGLSPSPARQSRM